MKKRILIVVAILGLFGMLWTVSGMVVHAQGPINDDWVRAYYMYDRPYSAPSNTWVWFKFDSDGDRSRSIEIILVNGNLLGLDMRIYTQEQVSRITEDKFIGRGNVIQVPCDTGKCDSQHLLWKGTFNVGGTYYVAVMNPKNTTIPFRILINGEGVSLGNEPPSAAAMATDTPPAAVLLATTTPPFSFPAPTSNASALPTTTPPFGAGLATTTPPSIALATLTPLASGPIIPPPPPAPVATATAQPPVNNSPYFAVFVPDNRPTAIAANAELWYKFDYTGDKSQITLSLPNGNAWGFDFKIYTSDNAFQVYTDDKFVGRGNAVNQPCATGSCTADDLTWIGSFPVAGTYFVRVINTKPLPQTFVLRIAGTAINIVGP